MGALLLALAVVIPAQVRAAVGPAPENLGVVARISPTAVKLAWSDASGLATGYIVQRSPVEDFSYGVSEIRMSRNTFDFIDETRAYNQTYFYRVQSVTGTDRSGFSNVVKARNGTGKAPKAPAAPDELRITRDGSVFKLTWRNRATNETGVWVQRSSDNGTTWEFRASLSLNSTRFDDQDPPTAAAMYRVWTFNSGGVASSYSVQYLEPNTNTPSVPNLGGVQIPSFGGIVPSQLPSVGIPSLDGIVPSQLPSVGIPTIGNVIPTIDTSTLIPTVNPSTLIPTIDPSQFIPAIPDINKYGLWVGILSSDGSFTIFGYWIWPMGCASQTTGACAPPSTKTCFPGLIVQTCYALDLDPNT